jgi:solute carrier family 35 protein F5
MVGVETFTRAKVLAVLASFIGLLLVTHSDSMISTASTIISGQSMDSIPDRRPKNALVGDGLALLSAVCYAVYVILLKVKIEDEERVDMQLFFGYVLFSCTVTICWLCGSFVGLFNTVFLLPFIPLLHVLGIETFQLPTRREEWVTCAINMVITLSSDYLYVLSMLKTTPLGEYQKETWRD